MTNEKAIKMLEYIKFVGNGESEYKNDAQAIALDMAIKALEQQSCENCISRQAVLEILEKEEFKGDAIYGIERLPSVTPKAKTGRWEYVQYDTPNIGNWHCSRCRGLYYSTDKPRWKYCPNCGARMETETKIEQGLNFSDQDTMMPAT